MNSSTHVVYFTIAKLINAALPEESSDNTGCPGRITEARLALLGCGATAAGVPGGLQRGSQGWGAGAGTPRATPASSSPQAVTKGDTDGLRKDLQSPLNLQASLK